MKKKGLVYRLTMIVGFGIIGMQTFGETGYSYYFKSGRTEQINNEKAVDLKIENISGDEEEEEEKKASGLLKSREQYKKDRLKKIKDMRYQENQTVAPTMEELKSKPSKKDIVMTPLVKRDDMLHRDNGKDNYM